LIRDAFVIILSDANLIVVINVVCCDCRRWIVECSLLLMMKESIAC